eukprot:383673-Amorphochlora_amoeboformis.AAC.2
MRRVGWPRFRRLATKRLATKRLCGLREPFGRLFKVGRKDRSHRELAGAAQVPSTAGWDYTGDTMLWDCKGM